MRLGDEVERHVELEAGGEANARLVDVEEPQPLAHLRSEGRSALGAARRSGLAVGQADRQDASPMERVQEVAVLDDGEHDPGRRRQVGSRPGA